MLHGFFDVPSNVGVTIEWSVAADQVAVTVARFCLPSVCPNLLRRTEIDGHRVLHHRSSQGQASKRIHVAAESITTAQVKQREKERTGNMMRKEMRKKARVRGKVKEMKVRVARRKKMKMIVRMKVVRTSRVLQ